MIWISPVCERIRKLYCDQRHLWKYGHKCTTHEVPIKNPPNRWTAGVLQPKKVLWKVFSRVSPSISYPATNYIFSPRAGMHTGKIHFRIFRFFGREESAWSEINPILDSPKENQFANSTRSACPWQNHVPVHVCFTVQCSSSLARRPLSSIGKFSSRAARARPAVFLFSSLLS